jgi:hypothetical protein
MTLPELKKRKIGFKAGRSGEKEDEWVEKMDFGDATPIISPTPIISLLPLVCGPPPGKFRGCALVDGKGDG